MMDLSAIISPAAQQLATAMVGDAWGVARDAIARRMGRGNQAETAKVAADLDTSRSRALAALTAGNQEMPVLYCIGYLDGLLAGRPELADMVESLPSVLRTAAHTEIRNYNSGTVGKLLQVEGDIHGGVTM